MSNIPNQPDDFYDPQAVEQKWQKAWEADNHYHAPDDDPRPKRYVLSMFPYPSGNIHIGHARNYMLSDVVSRVYRRMGCNTIHPIGYDSFGLPAEQAAINRNVHPADWIKLCMGKIETDFKRMGFSFTWDRLVNTSSPEYYRWTQWLFLKFHELGYVYKKGSTVNWCDIHGVLANEEAAGGVCWQCNRPTSSKKLSQWFLKISELAQELLDDIDTLEGAWPERVLTMQRNWIGRREGATIHFPFPAAGADKTIEVFTTRADTLFGVTFVVLAPELELVQNMLDSMPNRDECERFIAATKTATNIERMAEDREKNGVRTGLVCKHPLTGEDVEILLGDYVIADYGSGAVMGVPAHDIRDFAFAKKLGLKIKWVIKPAADAPEPEFGWGDTATNAYADYGVMINSNEFDNLSSSEGKKAVAEKLSAKKLGGLVVNYRLRDWTLSRQRYWGCPIPMVTFDEGETWEPIPFEDLPVAIPHLESMDVIRNAKLSPLADVPEFVAYTCPRTGRKGKRETDTLATFVCSSWYMLRFCDPNNDNAIFDPIKVNDWMPVDFYIGGIEHAVGHLLYSRFVSKVFQKIGMINFAEPWGRLLTQGMITKEAYQDTITGEWLWEKDVENKGTEKSSQWISKLTGNPVKAETLKMSKSKNNTVAPTEQIEKYGADTVRLFVLFAGPPELDYPWQEGGVSGCFKFLKKVWRHIHEFKVKFPNISPQNCSEHSTDLVGQIESARHNFIAGLTDDLELSRLHLNTAISKMMIMLNTLQELFVQVDETSAPAYAGALRTLIACMSPFTPHIAAELWERMDWQDQADTFPWEEHDPKWLVKQTIVLPVAINGKPRAEIELSPEANEQTAIKIALDNPKIQEWLVGKQIVKTVYVAGRMVNIVAK